MTEITFTIPTGRPDSFAWRRAFLAAIRKAIGQAQIDGALETDVAVEALKALPEASKDA